MIEKEDGKLYLANGKGAKVMIELGDGMAAVTGKVRVNGSFSKDEANAAYPYKLTVKKLTELKEKE